MTSKEEILETIELYCKSHCPLLSHRYECVYEDKEKCHQIRVNSVIPGRIRDRRRLKTDDLFFKAMAEIRAKEEQERQEEEDKKRQAEEENIIQLYCSGNPNSIKANILLGGCGYYLKVFLQDPHIEIDGEFQYGENIYYIFKRIATPAELESVRRKSLFSQLKLYASSIRKGVIDNEGKVIFEPTYLSISQFVGDVLLVKDKTEKYGLITLSGQILLPCSYDAIYPYRELVFGACKDGKVGFMDITGNEVIPFKYLPDNKETIFSNGLACVLDEGGFIYIDHQGAQYFKDHYRYHEDFGEDGFVRNEVCVDLHPDYRVDSYLLYLNGDAICVESEYLEDMKWLEEHNLRCCSQDENNDSDILDAYEGDPSARWNTD